MGGQGVSDAGQTLVVVVRHHILEPEQMVWLNSPANVNRLVHRPELVDITHQVDMLTEPSRSTVCARLRGLPLARRPFASSSA